MTRPRAGDALAVALESMQRQYADAPPCLRGPRGFPAVGAVGARLCYLTALRLHHAARLEHDANERAALEAGGAAPLAAAVVCELSRVELKATALLAWDAARLYSEALRGVAAARAQAARELAPFWVPPWDRGDAWEPPAHSKPAPWLLEARATLRVWSRSYLVSRETLWP